MGIHFDSAGRNEASSCRTLFSFLLFNSLTCSLLHGRILIHIFFFLSLALCLCVCVQAHVWIYVQVHMCVCVFVCRYTFVDVCVGQRATSDVVSQELSTSLFEAVSHWHLELTS